MKKTILTLLALIVAAFGGSQVSNLGGSAGSFPSVIATSSTVEVGEGVDVLFATTTGSQICSNRKITTKASAILIGFPGINKNGGVGTSSLQNGIGHLQAASSTIDYPAENNGCGAWIVTDVGGLGSSTIVITEYKQ